MDRREKYGWVNGGKKGETGGEGRRKRWREAKRSRLKGGEKSRTGKGVQERELKERGKEGDLKGWRLKDRRIAHNVCMVDIVCSA